MRPCMLSDLMGLKAVQPLPEEKKVRRNGKPRHDKRLGKVHQVVFSPNGRQVVGILISRPDVAGMVKRDDVFCALDSILE
ncbi:MAG: PRC-barrel domain containing protein, partial [Atopobiaceae bacterium]|nr:PRC-barrel domain containing protein [Atopobiaceae bacterium]